MRNSGENLQQLPLPLSQPERSVDTLRLVASNVLPSDFAKGAGSLGTAPAEGADKSRIVRVVLERAKKLGW